MPAASLTMQTPEVRQQPRGSPGGKVLPIDEENNDIATPSTVAESPANSPYDEAPPATTTTTTVMSIVYQAYGPTADLYQDVLRIEPTATDREIRTAYFRRGRQVLKEPDGDGVPEEGAGAVGSIGVAAAGPMSMSAVSRRSKLQFQAVSAAFDILSDPELKKQYDSSGTVVLPACTLAEDADNNVSGTSLFLRSRSTEGSSLKNSLNRFHGMQRDRSCNSSTGSSKRGIRWSNSVEELVIENDCASIASRRSWRCGGSLEGVDEGDEGAGGKKVDGDGDDDNLSVVSIESAASSVKETLRRLDESAETFTRKEFLDELETSVNNLLDAASRAIAEASAAASAAAANVASATEPANNESNNDAKGENSETLKKDSVSRKLNFDDAVKDEDPQKEEGVTSKPNAPDSTQETTAKAIAKANPKAATEEDPAADFYLFLSTYICGVVQELKKSLDHVGSLCANGELPSPSSCIIQDAELDGLVHMLRTEVDQHVEEINYPFDEIVSGESHLGKTIETFDTESVASTIATERNAPAGN